MSLYLLLDLAAVVIPFAFSFEQRLRFFRMWPALFLSMLSVGAVFVAWDYWFTRLGVWGFNETYLTGIYILNLPLEEYLFFICVPYAAVFTFHVFRTLLPHFSVSSKLLRMITVGCATALLIIAVMYYSNWYTCTAFLSAALTLFASYFYFRETLPHLLLSYLVILVPFFVMNGILTGSLIEGEVVWYNDAENLGLRILTIPVEDMFYGMSLIFWNVNLTVHFHRKLSTK
jgi:lycopene cyclase domain-containing protein